MTIDPTSEAYERTVADHWGGGDSSIRSFWQSPVVMAEINRRVTGDPQLKSYEYFIQRHCPTPRARGLSIGCGEGHLEREMMRLGACESLVAVDISSDRIERARAGTPTDLQRPIEFVCANLETWEPQEKFDLVIAKGALHHMDGLERLFDMIETVLADDGVLYVDEFVGPSRFQWTDKQLGLVNRLLDRLSSDLRRDLGDPSGGPKAPATRPTIADMIAADPSEAARSAELRDLLRTRFEPLEEREWGGAIFHLLFSRIMGNFVDHDDLVRTIMEIDAILTEERVVDSDCLYGVYRRRTSTVQSPNGRAKRSDVTQLKDRSGTADSQSGSVLDVRQRSSRPDGRLEAISGGVVVGWAADLAEPDRNLSIDVFVDNKLVRKTIANLFRADLASNGIGKGDHGLRVELPTHVLDGRRHYIALVARDLNFGLPLAADWRERFQPMSDGTNFEPMRYDPPPPDLPDPRVIEGRNGWAFLCDDANGNLDQLLGDLRFTESDLIDYRQILTRRHRELSRLGIPYIFAIAPAKEAIYSQYLPATTPPVGPPTTGRDLLDALRASPADIVDLHAPLRERAITGEDLYYRRDAHWNYDGALIAARTLLDAIRSTGLDVRPPAPSNLTWLDEHFVGDLADKPAVALRDGRLEPITSSVPKETSEESRRPGFGSLGLHSLTVPPHLEVSATRPSVVLESRLAPDGPRLIAYRDSSARWLMPFLASAFSRSAWLWQSTIDFNLIEREQPDVVLHLVTERFLPRVPYGDVR
jgi:SAM-dependent methyltransferase